MLNIPFETVKSYQAFLVERSVPDRDRAQYQKWVRYYLDFCHKYQFDENRKKSFSSFHQKLIQKNQSESQRRQAYDAVKLYYQMEKREVGLSNLTESEGSATPGSIKGTSKERREKHPKDQVDDCKRGTFRENRSSKPVVN